MHLILYSVEWDIEPLTTAINEASKIKWPLRSSSNVSLTLHMGMECCVKSALWFVSLFLKIKLLCTRFHEICDRTNCYNHSWTKSECKNSLLKRVYKVAVIKNEKWLLVNKETIDRDVNRLTNGPHFYGSGHCCMMDLFKNLDMLLSKPINDVCIHY